MVRMRQIEGPSAIPGRWASAAEEVEVGLRGGSDWNPRRAEISFSASWIVQRVFVVGGVAGRDKTERLWAKKVVYNSRGILAGGSQLQLPKVEIFQAKSDALLLNRREVRPVVMQRSQDSKCIQVCPQPKCEGEVVWLERNWDCDEIVFKSN
jgi:hypothetical protein